MTNTNKNKQIKMGESTKKTIENFSSLSKEERLELIQKSINRLYENDFRKYQATKRPTSESTDEN